jgi:ribosome-binding factor A
MVTGRRHGPQRPYPRVARVNAVLLEVLAEELERLADVDDRLRLVTVTGVDCDRGLQSATVYVASLPPDVAEALEDHRRILQRTVGAEVRMKWTPTLRFAADPAIAAGDAVEQALRRARQRPGGLADGGPV